MKSVMAALRNLVLPFGATSGTRIVLDGVNGRISFFDATDAEVIRQDSATAAITLGDADGTGSRLVLDGVNGRASFYNASNDEVIREDSSTSTVAVGDIAGSGARVVMDGATARLRAYNASNSELVRVDASTATVTAGSQTTGTRIVTSGSNARLSGYNSSNAERVRLDAASSLITVGAPGSLPRIDLSGGTNPYVFIENTDTDIIRLDTNGTYGWWREGDTNSEVLIASQFGSHAYVSIRPKDRAGSTWYSNAYLYADYSGSSPYAPHLVISSPTAWIATSNISLWGAGNSSNDDSAVTVNADNILLEDMPAVALAGASVATSSSGGFTTTETTVDSISFSAVAGRTYEITHSAIWNSTVAWDLIAARLRENNSSGTARDGADIIVAASFAYPKGYLRAYWTASSTGTKTFVVTGQRKAGSGTCIRAAGSTNQATLTVKCVEWV